jgi:hypothetical protein
VIKRKEVRKRMVKTQMETTSTSQTLGLNQMYKKPKLTILPPQKMLTKTDYLETSRKKELFLIFRQIKQGQLVSPRVFGSKS